VLLLVPQVVLRCGLMGPWDAGAPLVAQLTDEMPETRTAALRVSSRNGSSNSQLVRAETSHLHAGGATCHAPQNQYVV
jgi:hypothetical protein